MLLTILVLFFLFGGFFTAQQGFQSNSWIIGLIFNLLLTFFSTIDLFQTKENRNVFSLIIKLTLFAFFIESLGLKTCFPYGCFDYGEAIGPRLPFDLAPTLLPFTFLPLLFAAYELGRVTIHKLKLPQTKSIKIIVSTIILIGFDLILDPLAVKVGLWKYNFPPETINFFNVPISNFVGWAISGSISMAIIQKHLNGSNKNALNAILINGSFWLGVGIYYLKIYYF